MTDRTCKCLPIEVTMSRALSGEAVPACREHGTFGYTGHKADAAAGVAPPALNSEALESALAASLGAAVDKTGSTDHLHANQPNI